MSDAQGRGWLRRWRRSGSIDDGAAYLRARLREGDRAAVELAARCGEPAARQVVDVPLASTGEDVQALSEDHGPELGQRYLIGLVRRSLPGLDADERDDLERGLVQIEGWLWGRPAPRRALARLRERWASKHRILWSDARAARGIAYVVHDTGEASREVEAAHRRVVAYTRALHTVQSLSAATASLALPAPEQLVQRVLREDVAPWVLGVRDPVAERVPSSELVEETW